MKFFSSNKIIILVLVLSIATLLTGYVFLYKDIVSKSTKNAEMLNYIASESNREAYASSARKQLESLDSDIKKAKSSIVNSGDVVGFIEKIESIAYRNGLSISNNNISDEVNQKTASTTLTSLKIKSSTSGSWVGTYKFMSELESMPYKIKVNSFSISNMREAAVAGLPATGDSKWVADFEIQVLKYK